jgi:hypothetical protein
MLQVKLLRAVPVKHRIVALPFRFRTRANMLGISSPLYVF